MKTHLKEMVLRRQNATVMMMMMMMMMKRTFVNYIIYSIDDNWIINCVILSFDLVCNKLWSNIIFFMKTHNNNNNNVFI